MKKDVYICVTESLCCAAEINTTLQINYSLIKNSICFLHKYSEINPTLSYVNVDNVQTSFLFYLLRPIFIASNYWSLVKGPGINLA